MEYKNQHWVPKSYLKAWCDPTHRDKVVHVYGADGAYQGWRPYTRICSTDELYTVSANGKRDVSTEKHFKLIEDEFLKVRRAIERATPLPTFSKRILSWFAAAMRNRSPAARDHWQAFKDRVVEVGDQMAAALAAASPIERERMARASTHSLTNRTSSMTLDEAKAAAAEPFGKWVLRHIAIEAELLEKMSFAILKAPPGLAFITSDNPVVWHDTAPPETGRRHLGLGHASIEVSMPISPQYCLLFDHLGKDGTCDVGVTTVNAFNSRTLNSCDSCFIAQSSELAVEWFEIETSS